MSELATQLESITDAHALGGGAETTYSIILRVRLKAPLKTYTGGSTPQEYVNLGGTPASDTKETVKLTISQPAATYYLNAGTSGSPEGCVFLDYRLPVNVRGDATLTVEIDTQDSLVPENLVVGEDSVSDPENDVLDNYRGVFCQIDHDEEYISAVITETTGGGVRGFKFGGFSEQVLANGAEK
jgi:hypothetical protein